MKQIPFHFGIFYNAMIGYIGREPDNRVCQGYDGFYEFWYKPKDDKEAKELERKAGDIAKWLDCFEITFSGSMCQYFVHPGLPKEGKMLIIRILHPIDKKEK